MNPLTNMKNVVKLSEQELRNTSKSSWHDQYKDSAWIFIGGLPYDLTEGDIICIFSQYGEVVNINLIRAKDTGKSKGFCFLCYEDQRSTILAVDNLNGIKILNRTIRVDHVQNYKVPREGKKTDEETKKLYVEGCAPKASPPITPKSVTPKQDVRETIADQIEGDLKLPLRLPIYTNIKEENISDEEVRKGQKKKRKKKNKSKSSSDESSSNEHEENSDKKRHTQDSSIGRERHRDRIDIKDKNGNNNNKRDGKDVASRSIDTHCDEKCQNYKRDVSPHIPKRYRR